MRMHTDPQVFGGRPILGGGSIKFDMYDPTPALLAGVYRDGRTYGCVYGPIAARIPLPPGPWYKTNPLFKPLSFTMGPLKSPHPHEVPRTRIELPRPPPPPEPAHHSSSAHLLGLWELELR